MQQQIGRLMIHANFGRAKLSSPTLLMAHHYRLMVALLMSGLMLSHLLIVESPAPIVAALLVYGTYVAVRLRLSPGQEARFYTPRMQLWRAQAGIAGVTALLLVLGAHGHSGALWVLYLPALLLISRYCAPQHTYILAAAEVAALAAGTRLWELANQPTIPATVPLLGELCVRAFAVVLPSFLVHYLARVDITAKEGAAVRDQVVRFLLERALFSTDGVALWQAIREACATAVKADESRVFLYEASAGRLEPLDDHQATDPLPEGHPALRAVRERSVVEQAESRAFVSLAAPVFSQPERGGPPLAVVVLRVRAVGVAERRAARLFLSELLDQIWPICAYASIRQQFPRLEPDDNHDIYQLRLNDVLQVVLETLCHRLGFSYATISLVNEDTQEIGTVCGLNVPDGWVADAHHPLDSHDIQADVIRTGKVEVIAGWDPRFDPRIWQRYNHADLARMWAPLGRIGTIEAGFDKCEKSEVPRLLIEIVRRYARDVVVAIRNAQHYEREQRHAALMARLHEVSYELQTDPDQRDEATLLQHITDSAQHLFGADVVLLYPFDRRAERFVAPFAAGEIAGRGQLAEPNEHDNIVRYIGETRAAYYQPDAQTDARLAMAEQPGHGRRTFTVRQNILSFAGAPLLARGRMLGVLCVNYRERHQFSPYDRRAIELFAQQAAAVIAGGELVREQERRRLEYDLHDSVKSSVRGLILFSRAATDALEDDPARARRYLHELRRTAWGILGDVDIILNGLAPGADDSTLADFIQAELRRLVGRDSSKLVLDMDENIPALPMLLTRTLLNLIREAVINALDHAQAQTIRVSVSHDDDRVHLLVSDDGCGFVPEREGREEHHGLTIMRERVRMIGGTLEIVSSPGKGTIVRGELPQREAIYVSG